MTNRADRRRLKTHLDLLSALRCELAEVGADEITVGGVTERADVAIGTFYNHFADKAAALEALAEVETQALQLSTREMIGDEFTFSRSIAAVAVTMIQHGAVDPTWLAALVAIGDARYFPTPEIAPQVHEMAAAAFPDAETAEQVWRVRVFDALVCELLRSLNAGDLGSSMPGRIELAVSSLLGAMGFDEAVIDSEVEWANQLPIPTEWPSAETVLINTGD
ncbi:MAG: TetR/AcrR family transcriptional regulator [Actinomycetia bacterium]|nr:TetR/AcrR family transcriptional regulator [Actinomycetes bacterium]MCP4958357.1 TetR/AcrR family transcriptional regulator [Actinomycetes bacterium]